MKTWLGVFCLAAIGSAGAAPTITLHYNPRIPFAFEQNGVVSGVLVEPVVSAFRAAGVPFQWSMTPLKRQLSLIQANQGFDCLLGRFKDAEREAYSRFSAPFYRDRPEVALSRRDQFSLSQYTSLQKLILAPKLRLLVKDGYSYGEQTGEWLKARRTPPYKTTGENLSMLREVYFGQADFFLLSEEEAGALLAYSGLPKEQLQIHRYADAPAGELRYLMCSKKVPVELIESINHHLPNIKAP